MIKAASRLNLLIEDLLNYSRLSRLELELVPVPIAKVVAEAVSQLGDDNPNVETEIPDGLTVTAHEPILRQALFNLIGNGLKFHAPDVEPRVRVVAARQDGKVRIEVRDNGIGIAPQHQERIFRVFERLHDQKTFPGTGIGLAIVKRGVQRMGGTLGLDSSPGRGSTFWMEFPSGETPA